MSDTASETAARGKFMYSHPRPMVTVDAVVFGVAEGALHVVLVQRKHAPFAGAWALPGGFIEMDEDLNASVCRELAEETGLRGIQFEQFGAYGDPGRDPRGRTISVAYFALVSRDAHAPAGDDDAADAAWFALHELPSLAFDHQTILRDAVAALRSRTRHAGVGGQVMKAPFTLEALRELYETVRGTRLDAGQFQREMVDLGIIDPVESAGAERRYRFNPARLAPV